MTSILERLRTRWRNWAVETTVPHIVEFDLPNSPAEDSDARESVHGLAMSCTALSADGGSRRLITFWPNHEVLRRDLRRLCSEAALGEPVFQGFVTSYHEKRENWWKRVHWITAFLAVTSILGVLETLHAHYDWLFLKPQLWPQQEHLIGANYVVGQSIDEGVTLTNRTSVDHQSVAIEVLPVAGIADLQVRPSMIPTLRPADSVPLRVTGIARKRGDYMLRIAITASAGFFPGEQRTTFPMSLRVWPDHPVVDSLQLTGIKGAIGTFEASVVNGYALSTGLKCTAEVVGNFDLQNMFANMPGLVTLGHWVPPLPGPNPAGHVDWETRGIDGFRNTKLTMTAVASAPLDWNALRQHFKIACYEK